MNTWSIGSSTAPALNSGFPGYPSGKQPISDKYATYLKLFSGELFKAYQDAQVAKGTVTSRTLRNGKSMQFIFTGGLDSHYHTPGTPILGQAPDSAGVQPGAAGYADQTADPPVNSVSNGLPVAEKTIICDDLLIASTFVYDLDEVFAHYDLRGEIARKLAYALANRYDQNIFKTVARASREGRAVSGQSGGNVLYFGSGTAATDPQALVASFYRAATIFDEQNVPATGRVAVLAPEQYYSLITGVSNNIINAISPEEQGTAVRSGDWGYQIAGITIKKSNNVMPDRFAHTFASGENNDYRVGGTTANTTADNGLGTCGLIYHKDSVGVVEAVGPQVQTTNGDVSVMYQGDLIVGKVAMGAGTLNPAGAISLTAGANHSATSLVSVGDAPTSGTEHIYDKATNTWS